MAGEGYFAHAERGLWDTLILAAGCNDSRGAARGKKSTAFVDNFAENFSRAPNFPCFRQASPCCLFFRQFDKALILLKRFLDIQQIPDKSGDFIKHM
jgi:hypothetical protein